MANWILKRNDNGQSIELHRQYAWKDEYDWTPLAQSNPIYTLTGGFDIQQGTMLAGRPITLDCTHAELSRATVKTLQAWGEVPELEMTLTHPDGRTFSVAYRRPILSDIKMLFGKDIRPIDELPTDKMTANINLMTV